MSLYDDAIDERVTEKVAEWSSGIKLLQSQLQLFKAVKKPEPGRKIVSAVESRVSSKAEESLSLPEAPKKSTVVGEWSVRDEYDPAWPNEYEKVVRELREKKERSEREKRSRKRKSRFEDEYDDEDDECDTESAPKSVKAPAIETKSTEVASAAPISSVAAKIMAKYGFKEGQGLGRQEQGIAAALQVEKTSKRGGRIVQGGTESTLAQMPPPPLATSSMLQPAQPVKPNLTEMMKNPSKIVLLLNMVGPGEVDADLEPEVREECNTKYGDVTKVIIKEIKDVVAEEAVRIFVEFKRMESAIKAVVDLNGRFFGGRTVRALFYQQELYQNEKLLEPISV